MLNNVIIIGRLTRQPEISTTLSGKQLCRFTVANDSGTKEKPDVGFYDVIAWGEKGEFVERYFSKGDPIIVSGKLHQSEYEDKTGAKRKRIEIIAREVEFTLAKKNAEQKIVFPGNEDLPF